MRKIFLLILLTIVSIEVVAQELSEVSLLGQWEIASVNGEYYGFTERYREDDSPLTSFKYLYFGTLTPDTQLPDYDGDKGVPKDFDAMSGGCFYGNENPHSMYDEEVAISDFFISDKTKLHISITSYENVFRFIIEDFNDHELHLKSFDGKCDVVYKRVQGSSKLQSMETETAKESSSYYSLSGIRTSDPQKGVNIVMKDNKLSKEVR